MRSTRTAFLLAGGAWLLFAGTILAATPPSLMNYEGVLRDSSGQPLDGDFDMVFRFFTADVAGDEILVDVHDAANGNPVTVTAGLFSVALGGGIVSDGTGPGTYTSVAEVFRDHAAVWLSVQVGIEVLTPRVRLLSAGYALNASHLEGRPSAFFLDTSSTAQTKSGPLTVFASATGGSLGVEAYGDAAGGYFQDTGSGGGYAYLGYGTDGIHAFGPIMGGLFDNSNGSGFARIAYVDYGIDAVGEPAGYFKTTGLDFGEAKVGSGGYGIDGTGSFAGGYFKHQFGNYARVGTAQYGIEGYGSGAGGFFADRDGSGQAYVGYGDYGIWSLGDSAGGYLKDTNASGYAYVGYGDYGIQGYGNTTGGYFKDLNQSGWARVGYGDTGIEGYGNASGGYFEDLNGTGWAQVGASTYKIIGNGAVSFVQNHPERHDQVIVYHAPEASEVAVYARGSARLSGGVAQVALDSTFTWVANPDLGLTAHVTPRSACPSLHVESVSTRELSVRCDDPSGSDLAFDYIVWGLRIGFEEVPPVQPKEREARIPSMKDHRDLYAKKPELRGHNALERFKTIEAGLRGLKSPESVDLTASRRLAAKVEEFDPAVNGIERPGPTDLKPVDSNRPEAGKPAAEAAPTKDPASLVAPAGVIPVNVAQPESRSQAADVTYPTMTLSAPAEPGDVLSLDPERPGLLRPAASLADPGVVGVAMGLTTLREEEGVWEAPVATSGVVQVRADAGYAAIRPGDLLTSSPTAGRAMRAMETLPGTLLGKALEGLETGTGTIRIVVLLR